MENKWNTFDVLPPPDTFIIIEGHCVEPYIGILDGNNIVINFPLEIIPIEELKKDGSRWKLVYDEDK